MSLLLDTDLLPRRYQEEIFRRAQEGNIIAALDTGSGKTFISILLIKWIASTQLSTGKIIVFLVPKVTLVEQQGSFIAKHTPLRVSKLHGSVEFNFADRARWRKEFEENDVLVMTAQVFLNVITHSHWSINKVSLMVVDECHHTQKNHPYNGIMREYAQIPSPLRPKIFGMTASPIWDPRDASSSLATLERNLDSTVVGVREHITELFNHTPKPVEVIKEYAKPPDIFDYPSPTLRDCLDVMDLPDDIGFPWAKVCTRYEVTLRNTGPFCAELFLYGYLKHRIYQLTSNNPDITGDPHSIDPDPTGPGRPSTISRDLLNAAEIVEDFSPFFDIDTQLDPSSFSVPLSWCSPKLATLVDILLAYHSPTSQGIIFVQQRQVAISLAKVLPCMPALKGRVRCAQLVGHGTLGNGMAFLGEGMGMPLTKQRDVVKMFRDGELNLLIATSVAEEGLDFPECDVVIRFDPVHHMVGYVQSRGRARSKTSTFVVMIEENSTDYRNRYKTYTESEPQLRQTYQSRAESNIAETEDEWEDPADNAERERYVVEATGATLSYDSSINLLTYLCSLIPRDPFTPQHLPEYAITGSFQCTVRLPSTLPLPTTDLVHTGTPKRSKKEAKRAAAFAAVKRLHIIGVFDDWLMPTSAGGHQAIEDADGVTVGPPLGEKRQMMHVDVRNPWSLGPKLWIHVVYLERRKVAGMITGTILPPADVTWRGLNLSVRDAAPIVFDVDVDREVEQRKILQEFTALGIWYCNTRKAITSALSAFLAPLDSIDQPDFTTMRHLVSNPYGSPAWSGIGEEACHHLMVMNNNQIGRSLLLTRFRPDLTARSAPPLGSREEGFRTLYDYYITMWTRPKRRPYVPVNSPLIEAHIIIPSSSGKYQLRKCNTENHDVFPPPKTQPTRLIPRDCCRVINLSEDIRTVFHSFPVLAHRMTDIYRVHQARLQLGLPAIADDILVEALTLPAANASYDNQRLETLGDSVLKLAVTVHVYNKYPHRHEGQLSMLRTSSISNRTLRARAKEIGLEQFLTCEGQSVQQWRYTVTKEDDVYANSAVRYARREFPVRSLQDCMEAILGAAYLTGDIPMALRAATALRLTAGGPLPWSLRYSRDPSIKPVSALFKNLEQSLGYEFHNGDLVVESVTHPSFSSFEHSSYQRLEFLGDALIDLVVMKYIYDKFPQATPGQLSLMRSRAVCSPALALIAIKRLGLHRLLLINNAALSTAITKYVPLLETTSAADVVAQGWKLDPPKAISDVLESLMGAVLVDTAWNFDKASSIAECVLEDVLEVLTPNLPLDPISELMMWVSKAGCRRVHFQKGRSSLDARRYNSVSVLVHGIVVADPITSNNIAVAKALVAERAHAILRDTAADSNLAKICDCQDIHAPPENEELPEEGHGVDNPTIFLDTLKDINSAENQAGMEVNEVQKDETELGFAAIAEKIVVAFEGRDGNEDDQREDNSGEDSSGEGETLADEEGMYVL